MTIVQHSILIQDSPENIMATLIDARRWPEWYPGMTQASPDNRFPEKGGKVTFTTKSGIASFQVTETVLDYQPAKLHAFQIEGMMSGNARWELTPEGATTRLNTTFDYTLMGGPLGQIMDTLLVKRMNSSSLEEGLKNLKTRIEGR